MKSLIEFLKRKKSACPAHKLADRGFLVFENTTEVIQAERILKEAGIETANELVGSNPERIMKATDFSKKRVSIFIRDARALLNEKSS